MALTQKQCEMIKASWNTISNNEFNSLRFVMDFYSKIFELTPSAKSLFKGGMTEQGKALIGMLSTVVINIDSLSNISDKVESLGKRHGKYGITPNMYVVAGRALVFTLASRLPDDEHKKEYADAWMDAYSFLASVMCNAAGGKLDVSSVRQCINPEDIEENKFKKITKTDKTLRKYLRKLKVKNKDTVDLYYNNNKKTGFFSFCL